MSSKTKIVVLKSKELIYTGIFIVLGIMLILLLFYMFSPGDKDSKKNAKSTSKDSINQNETVNQESTADSTTVPILEDSSTLEIDNEEVISDEVTKSQESTDSIDSVETFSGYVPGVYTSELNLGGSTLLLSVTVDENKVTGVTMDNMDETLTAMYPLVQPSLDEINSQIGMVSSVEDITYSADNKYTTILILDAINEALESSRK